MPEHILSGIKAIVAMKLKKEGKLQREIAEYLKMDRSIISHYLHGRHPSDRVMRVSEEIVDLPAEYGIRIINSMSEDRELTKKIIDNLYHVKIEIDRNKCILCGECLECPYNAIFKNGHLIEIDNNKCMLCGDCIAICPVNALKLNKFLPNELEE
ncbi:4Fe-4S binding protein [Methanothermococcus okinawensis]|uniref:4Fe-4S ferredoxin iron-sulfur binding domain-containing protein n=1 Tax=Methanothermococcus okinawensis (strain DSM 14208 / JCM 11175 / IH1) TaxID=647113 RepID=F8AME5_METOI|nr:4Fe-4S binding protein [Methanothermococcus okinawensis]AEH06840.1 4Fe-4S ferredoxin iron-sulfur binding domain-containing protein [Methanothermococcus okinawensis IH1]